jgi:hypothetical protein
LQVSQIADACANRNRLDMLNLADDFEFHVFSLAFLITVDKWVE